MDARGSLLPAQLAGVVVLASVVAVDPGGWYPFVVAKFAAVALAVVMCWWASSSDRSDVLDRRAVRAFAALVLVMSVAALFGRDRFYAWTGTPERHLGVATWVLFFAAFVSGARLTGPDRLARFVRWVTVSGIALGAYTMIERWHQLIATDADTDRLGGTYGSATFLGAALCLILPVSVAATIGDDSVRWRVAAAISTALGTAALIGSGTRAAWLALGVCALVPVAARLRSTRSATPTITPTSGRTALPIAAVVVGAVASVGTNASVAARTAGSSSRLDEWALGARVVGRNLWFGVGPEGYRTALADGVTASYERTHGRVVLPDRAHNIIIDVAAAGGVLAAITYLILAGLVVVAAWRACRQGSTLRVGLAVAALAYLVQQFFLFPVATIDPIFWLFAGILVAVPGPLAERAPRRVVAPVAVAALVTFFLTGVLALAADRAARNAVESEDAAAADRAISLRPDVARYRLLAAALAPPTSSGYDDAVARSEQAHRITPNDPIVERAVADALTKRAIATGETTDRSAALDAWQRLTDDDPNCYPCHLGLGYAAALSADIPRAIEAFQVAASLESDDATEAADALDGLAQLSGTDSDG